MDAITRKIYEILMDHGEEFVNIDIEGPDPEVCKKVSDEIAKSINSALIEHICQTIVKTYDEESGPPEDTWWLWDKSEHPISMTVYEAALQVLDDIKTTAPPAGA